MATRGYGVHSPLAFKLVKNVIRPKRNVVYYGEERLEDLPQPFSIIRKARILLRFVAELQPAYVWASSKTPEILLEAVKMAGGVVRIYDGDVFPDEIDKADLIILYQTRLTKKILSRQMKRKVEIAGFDLEPRMIETLTQLFSGGVMLEGEKSLLIVNRPQDAPHFYLVNRF